MMKIQPEYLIKNGTKEYAILSYEEFEKLKEYIEDLEDLVDLREAKEKEKEATSIPFEKVKKSLNI
ncbi:MAG: hypothetical protein JW881_05755 [Spirochaetales bacterium]|nr:hypothetical protein [Spirochaetales bacterium]